jgi:hypothetical protein
VFGRTPKGYLRFEIAEPGNSPGSKAIPFSLAAEMLKPEEA